MEIKTKTDFSEKEIRIIRSDAIYQRWDWRKLP